MALFDLRLKKLDQDIAHASSYQAYQEACLAHDEISGAEAVSYTHLTLPTIYSV